MKTFVISFADGRRVPVDLPIISESAARRICERRYRLARVVDVREDRTAIDAARRKALSQIRQGLGQR